MTQDDKLSAKAIAAYKNGHTIRAVAQKVGRSYGWVHRTLVEADVPRRPRGGRVAVKRTKRAAK